MTTTQRAPIGTVTVGKTTYLVSVVKHGENTRAMFPEQRSYSLEGPNGATYYVTDHGPRYHVTSMAMGGSKTQRWSPAPRPLRGLTREHVAAFRDHAEHRA